jgi:hypothetical protein
LLLNFSYHRQAYKLPRRQFVTADRVERHLLLTPTAKA